MPELEETNDPGGNLSAVQSISARLLEVTRLAEKLDARLCEAGARTRAVDSTFDERTKPELSLTTEKTSGTSQEASAKGKIQPIQESDRSAIEDSNVEEYVTATDCSSTPVPRSRSESFLSSEYEDALVSTTCRKVENELTKKTEVIPVLKNETITRMNPNDQEVIIKYSPNGATVTQRTFQEKGGKIVKEVTETTTLHVSQDTRMGVASYKLVSNTLSDRNENVDVQEFEDLTRTLVNNEAAPMAALQARREEHMHTSANGCLKNYHKSSADFVDESSQCYKKEIVVAGRRVSEEQEEKEELPEQVNAATPELVSR